MLRVHIDPKPMVQIVITASFIRDDDAPRNSTDPEVERYVEQLELEFGGRSKKQTENATPLQQVTSFSIMFAEFLSLAGIDSSAHQLLVFEDRFVGVLTVRTDDAEKISDWYESLRKQDEDGE